jgi:hypothetical protein
MMNTRHPRRWLLLLVIPFAPFAPFALAACDNGTIDSNRLTGPSPFVAEASSVDPAPFSVSPATIPFATLPGFGCPFAAPFASEFRLFIDQRRGGDIFLHEVGFRFRDISGLTSPLLFTRSELAGMFHTTFVPAGATRDFSFATRFGCGFTSRPHSLAIRLLLRDRSGAVLERTASAPLK